MADNTKEETKPTDDLDFLQEVNYSYRKEFQMKKPPYAPHVRDHHGDLGREIDNTFELNEAHSTQQPPLDIQSRYEPHPIEPYAAPVTKDTKQDDSYELYRDD